MFTFPCRVAVAYFPCPVPLTPAEARGALVFPRQCIGWLAGWLVGWLLAVGLRGSFLVPGRLGRGCRACRIGFIESHNTAARVFLPMGFSPACIVAACSALRIDF